jgi:pilus assembly protein CpaE
MNQSSGILLLDETQAGRLQLQKEVMAAGYPVAGEAATPREALAATREIHPDVVLVALEEPLVRGLRTIETVAAALPDVPVVAVSARYSRDLFRKAVLAGAHDLLTRPINGKELEQTVEFSRRMAERREQRADPSRLIQGTIISFFGPKGGVGKTTLATNLGVSIARARQERVVLVDLDTQVGAAAINLNLVPGRTVLDVMENLDQMDGEMLKSFVVTHSSGLDLLPAPIWDQEDQQDLTPADVEALLALVANHYDYVVVDTPGYLNSAVMQALRVSTYAVCVTSLEIASIQACKRVLERIAGWEFARDKVKLVTNVPNSANSVTRGDLEAALGYPVFWSIPFDQQVGAASQAGQPVVLASPGCRAAQSVAQLHYALTGTSGHKPGGLLGRLAPWKH